MRRHGPTFVLLIAMFAFALPAAAAARSVYWLNLDELSAYAVMDTGGSIYRERFPGLAAVASQATFFPNHTSVADNTHSAIPAALTGQRPVGKKRGFDYARSIFAFLPSGSRVRSVEAVTDVCARSPRCVPAAPRPASRLGSLRLSAPGFSAGMLRTDHAQGLTRSGGMIASVSGRDTFWFNHMMIPHVPWRYLPSGDQYYYEEAIPGMYNADAWGPQEALVRQGEQRMLLQAQFADRMILALKARLVQRGLWDSSLVIITADHGGSYRPDAGRRRLTEANFADITNVPLLVKFPGQAEPRVSGELTSTLDLMPTVLDYLGVQPPAGLEGRPLQGVAGRGLTSFTTRAGWPDGSSLNFTLDRMVEERRRSLEALESRFPLPSPVEEKTPIPQAVGTSTVTARIDNRRALATARPGSGRLPSAFLAGSLSEALHARRLLFVVNGGKVASTESRLDGKTARFTVMLPGLRRGVNEVKIFIGSPEGWLAVAQR